MHSKIKKVLKGSENDKSPGRSRMNLELLKYGGKNVVKVITLIYKKIV